MSGESDTVLRPDESSTTTASTTSTSPAAAAARPYCTPESKVIMRRMYCATSNPISNGVLACRLDLGSVLTRNRDVVGRLRLLLNCPYARSPHTAMLYASIVSHVLLWYSRPPGTRVLREGHRWRCCHRSRLRRHHKRQRLIVEQCHAYDV